VIGVTNNWRSANHQMRPSARALFAGRVLPFDDKAALIWARLVADGKASGRPGSGLDMIIAAVAEARDCTVVTDNERDFAGLRIENPMRGSA